MDGVPLSGSSSHVLRNPSLGECCGTLASWTPALEECCRAHSVNPKAFCLQLPVAVQHGYLQGLGQGMLNRRLQSSGGGAIRSLIC